MSVGPSPDQTIEPGDVDPAGEASLRPLLIQTVVVTAIILLMVALGAMFMREPLEAFAHWVVEELGVFGVFLGVLATDSLTFPIPPDTYLFVAVAAHTAVVPLLAACCVGSILGGSVAYAIGPYIKRLPFLNARLEAFRPKGERLFLKYGTWTVAIAALSPVPFSVTCWLAGIYNMPYRPFVIATLARIPRLLGYYYLFKLGWSPAL